MPAISISPLVAASSPFRQRRNVLLPLPEGPMTTTTSFSSTCVLIPLRISLWPKDLCRSLTFINLKPPLQVGRKLRQREDEDEVKGGDHPPDGEGRKGLCNHDLALVDEFDDADRRQQRGILDGL